MPAVKGSVCDVAFTVVPGDFKAPSYLEMNGNRL